jgi:hypothetical protein
VRGLLIIVSLVGCGFHGAGGPGALGALPSGYCCTRNTECRNRRCESGACVDSCQRTSDCPRGFTCDALDLCDPPADFLRCLDQSTFTPGSRPTGACCDGTGDPRGGECAGGSCINTGSSTGASYCTQGCDLDSDCPRNYGCWSLDAGRFSDGRMCWKLSSIRDPSTVETCE